MTAYARTTGEFSVHQVFSNGDFEEVLVRVDAETAVDTAKSLIESIGGRIGTTARVIITDADGFLTFDWRHGQGVVFPTEAECTAMKEAPT